jgi:hypothetical protein
MQLRVYFDSHCIPQVRTRMSRYSHYNVWGPTRTLRPSKPANVHLLHDCLSIRPANPKKINLVVHQKKKNHLWALFTRIQFSKMLLVDHITISRGIITKPFIDSFYEFADLKKYISHSNLCISN